jgi:azurin
MKNKSQIILLLLVLLSACGQQDGQQGAGNNTQPAKGKDNQAMTVPGVDSLSFTDTIRLSANENMRFDKDLFRVKAGKNLRLIFHNTGAVSGVSMDHNVVILQKGVEMADFADVASKAKNEQYTPATLDSLMVAHTRLVKGGGADTIAFAIKDKGVYDFMCSFPGHWGTMQGKIVAE